MACSLKILILMSLLVATNGLSHCLIRSLHRYQVHGTVSDVQHFLCVFSVFVLETIRIVKTYLKTINFAFLIQAEIAFALL